MLLNKCSCNPLTDACELLARVVVRALLCESKFLVELPKEKLFTKRVFLSLVKRAVPADFKSLKRGFNSSLENFVEN
jgi:Cft2 family RNA processing exonuclease